MSNATKDGVEVKPEQIWLYLDKRMGNRHCKVIAVEHGNAKMHQCWPDGRVLTDYVTVVSIKRMHKAPKTGWALVDPQQ